MFCPDCGHENPDTSGFCMKCGASLRVIDQDVPTEEPSVSGYVPPAPPGSEERPKKKRWLGLVLAIGAVVVLLAAAAFAVVKFAFPGLLPQGEHVLLAFPNRNGESDLYLVKLGKNEDDGQLIAENAIRSREVSVHYRDDDGLWSPIGLEYGGFVPQTNRVYYWYEEEGDAMLRGITIGDKESHEIIEPKGYVSTRVFAGSDTALLLENRDDTQRCYAAKFGQEAERLVKGGRCYWSADGSAVLVSEVDDGKTTVAIMGIDGKDETVLLDDAEDVDSFRLSPDGSRLVYVQETAGLGAIQYARSNGTVWTVSEVGGTGDAGPHISLAIDSLGWPHLCYQEETGGTLEYMHFAGLDWNRTLVDNLANVGTYCDIALDSDDNPHFSYYDETNKLVKYARLAE